MTAAGPVHSRDPEELARQTCLRLLSARPRTRAELAAALAKRDVPEDVVETVLRRFEELGWVDDAAFAEQWVLSRHDARGLSRRRLGQELRLRGVDPETVAAAAESLSDEDEAATAFALARRRAASSRHLSRDVRIRRLTGVLLRKGYPSGLVTRAVLAALGEAEAGAVDEVQELQEDQGLD